MEGQLYTLAATVHDKLDLTESVLSVCRETFCFCVLSTPFQGMTDSKNTTPGSERHQAKQVQKQPQAQTSLNTQITGTPEKDVKYFCSWKTFGNNNLHRSSYLPRGGRLGISFILFKEKGGI